MTADQTRLKASFIQWDIPATKQEDLPSIFEDGELARMDSQHVTFTALGSVALALWNGETFSYCQHSHTHPGEEKDFPEDKGPIEIVSIDRKILLKILDNMDSDSVKIKVKTNAPIRLLGQIGETPAGAAIAPRINTEEE